MLAAIKLNSDLHLLRAQVEVQVTAPSKPFEKEGWEGTFDWSCPESSIGGRSTEADSPRLFILDNNKSADIMIERQTVTRKGDICCIEGIIKVNQWL